MADKRVIYSDEVQFSAKGAKELADIAKRAGNAEKSVDEMKKSATSARDTIKQMVAAFKMPVQGKATEELKALRAEAAAAEKSVTALEKRQRQLAKQHTNSAQYKELKKDVDATEKELDELIERQIAWAEMGMQGSGPFQTIETQIEQTNNRLAVMKERLAAIAETGATDEEAAEWFRLCDALDAARGQAGATKAALNDLESSGRGYEYPAFTMKDRLKAAANAAMAASPRVAKFGKVLAGMRKALHTGANAVRRVTAAMGRFGKAVARVASKIPLLNKIPKIFSGAGRGLGLGVGIKNLLRLGVAGVIAYQGIRMAKEGMDNLVQYSAETNNSLSQIKSALATLKNALATAFAPVLNAIAPAITALINMLTKAATAIAHFTAAFTGKSTVVVAKNQTVDYASSLSDAAESAGDAEKAAKAYQKTLLGFDQINKLEEATESSNAGSSGGGGGGGAGGVGGMFETVEVSNGAKALADRIKDAWKAADFTDLGKEFATKIANALNSIPWAKIKAAAGKVGSSVATFLNGVFATKELWESVGTTFAEALNTIIEAGYNFVTKFKWKKFGSAIATAVNTFFKKLDLKKAAKTFSTAIKGILESIGTFAREVNWKDIGRKVGDAIASVDWIGIITAAVKAAGNLATGLLRLLTGAVQGAIDGLKRWIQSGHALQDILDFGKASLSITANIIGAGWELLTTIIDGIKGVAVDIIVNLWKEIKSGAQKFWDWAGEKLGWGEGFAPTSTQNTLDFRANLSMGKVDEEAKKLVNKGGGTTDRTVNQGIKKNTGQWNTSALSVANKAAGDVSRILRQGVIRGGSWRPEAVAMANKSGNVGRVLRQGVIRGGSWVSEAVTMANKGGGTVNRTLSMGVKFASAAAARIVGTYIAGISALNGLATGGILKGGRWQPVTAAASGGVFSQGQVFIAREAGPEMVGTIGGHTAVINNDQIVASVAAGVAKAVAATIGNGGNDVYIIAPDGNEMFKVMQNQASNYMNATGLSPFPA